MRGGRHHHRRGRPLGQGDLRYLLLHLLAERPRHGYDLIKAVEELTGGAYVPSPGVVYPTLTLLEELGYAEVAEPGSGKKLYSLTAVARRRSRRTRSTSNSCWTDWRAWARPP